MKHISEVVVLATQYLSERNDEDYTEDDDLKVIEDAAATLLAATLEEKRMVKAAALELGLADWAAHMGLE